jgi:predicted SAM-dependent methyltransferase
MKVLRRMIDSASSILGYLKRRQRRTIPAGYASPTKVNLGCGLAIAAGWINIDGSLNALIASSPSGLHPLAYRLSGASRYYSREQYCRLLSDHVFVHHDLVHGIPLADACADFVYSSHFLEHLNRNDAEHLLCASFRILKPGGTLRIVVPDLEYALSLYSSGKKKMMLTQYFFVEDDGSHYAQHKYMYDFALLKEALEKIGFKEIRRCSFRHGKTPDLDTLDNRPEDSLFVEATR